MDCYVPKLTLEHEEMKLQMNINLKLWRTKDVFCMPEHVSCSYQFPVAYRSLTTKSPMHLFMKGFKTSRLLINQKHQIKIHIDNNSLFIYGWYSHTLLLLKNLQHEIIRHIIILHIWKRKCLFSYTIFLLNPFSFQFSKSL